MRKVISILLVFVMVCGLVGCSSSKPESVVKSYCESLKNYKTDVLYTYMVDGEASVEQEEDLMDEVFMTFFKENAKELKYTVGDAIVDGDKASVSVLFKYVDASTIMEVTLGEYVSQAISLLFSGASDEVVESLLSNIFMDKSSTLETSEATETVIFNCVKIDDDWKIEYFSDEDATKLMNVMTCGISDVLNSFDKSFNEGNTDTQIDEPVVEEWVESDVPVGNIVELATLNMQVKSSYETDKLTGEYMKDLNAQLGTKFVVVEFSVENTTKNIISYNHELHLIDNQGREYSPYSEALWYFDESFIYTDLQPNIPVIGYVVYQVPIDSEDCFMPVAKSGTNEAYRLLID